MADSDGPGDSGSSANGSGSLSSSTPTTPIAGAMQGIAESSVTSETNPADVGPQSVSNNDTATRSELLSRARAFLTSPGVVHEAPDAKRRFLAEKGLTSTEVDALLHELPPQAPAIPPRTYPQPPPSNLPYLLLGLTKIMAWLTGASALAIIFYWRFLLPRLTRSALARRALKQHQVSLLKRLNSSLTSLRDTQKETFAALPAPPLRHAHEPSEFARKQSWSELSSDGIDVPEHTLLRCAIAELSKDGRKPTREELFSALLDKYEWLKSEKGTLYQASLWNTLQSDPCFSESSEDDRVVWSYSPGSEASKEEKPEAQPSGQGTALLTALEKLKTTFPPPRPHPSTTPSPAQRTLEALGDFTGYITTQTYQFAARTMPGLGSSRYLGTFSQSPPLDSQEEEIRKEIRMLKGLVLNRRTFAPVASRPT